MTKKITLMFGLAGPLLLGALIGTVPAMASVPQDLPSPTKPAAMPGATYRQISAGRDHTCAVAPNATAWCWGGNAYGQLGNGTLTQGTVPAMVNLTGTWRSISAGAYHTCGIQSNGQGYCWGANFTGQLGDGTATNSALPMPVAGSATWISISAGGWDLKGHTCGIKSDGTAWCWGAGGFGQLGNGTIGASLIPVQEISIGPKWRSISAGAYHNCGTLTNGAAWCWGANYLGQLGNGTTANASQPVAVSNPGPWMAISAGGVTVDLSHTCALRTTGRAWCWGAGGHGQLGNGGTANQLNPVPVATAAVFRTISAGGLHTCATRSVLGARCWGKGSDGQLGTGGLGSTLVPAVVLGPTLWTQAEAGGYHTAGIKAIPSTAWAWGLNANGQLGNGSLLSTAIPTLI